ncbi:MAG: hypothetical protein PHH77_06690 [Victivallaceae bacterium]|nr:hypothetical protein [Victivallaceae bacterium]
MVLSPRLKALLIPAVISVPVLVVLGFFCFFTEPEALTADQIINKKDWTKKELTQALASAFSPQTNRLSRHQVLSHLRAQLRRYPENERSAVRVAALRHAIDNSVKQMRLLPGNDRRKLITSIYERAENSYDKVRQMSAGEKARLRLRLDSPEGRVAVEEINKVLLSKLTAEERRELAPVTKIWVKTLRSL